MPREQDNRPGKQLLRKKTTDGLEARSENIGDTSCEGFNLRTERQDVVLGRNREPTSVHSTITRNKQQARKFAEHAAKPLDAQTTDTGLPQTKESVLSDATQPDIGRQSDIIGREHPPDTLPATDSVDGNQSAVSGGSVSNAAHPHEPPSHFDTSAKPPGRTASNKRGSGYQRRFDELRADKPDTATPAVEPDQDTARYPDLPQTTELPQTQQTQEALPDGQPLVQKTSLSHEHAPRSTPERPGRLRYGGTKPAPKEPPRRVPTFPNAAKYTPTAEVKTGSKDAPAGKKHTEEPAPAQDSVTDAKPSGSEHDTEGRKLDKPGKLKFSEDEAAPAAESEPPDKKPVSGKPNPDGGDAPAAEDKQSAAQEEAAHEKLTPTQDSGSERGTERSKPDKPGKLKFSENESAPADKNPANKKLAKAQSKAEHSAAKLDKAQNKLSKKYSVRREKVFDKERGKVKKKLRFETEIKSQHEHLKGPLITRPAKLGANAAIINAHRKIYQVEHENVGTQAAHKGTMLVEGGLRGLYRHHKTAPYRKVEKLTKKTTMLNVKASYQQALNDNPNLKSNPFSRMAQKRKIKKQYAKATQDAKKAGQSIKKTGDAIVKIGQAAVRMVARHPAVLGIIGALFLLVVIISALFTSCSNMASGIGSSIMAISYLAPDEDVDDAELHYTEWETDLLMQIDKTESDYPGYDEYRYSVDNIGHNPHELMAFLTAVYGEFNYANIESVLRQVFNEQYQLTTTPSIETRYADPDDTDNDGDYEPYDWHVLTVTLTSRSFTDVINTRMTADQRQHYNLLMMSKGSRQYAGSPFDFNWLPYVTSYYGYRIHPTSGVKDYHMGIDIGVPVGTDIHAAHDGTVTTGYDAGGYGYYITLTSTDSLVTKYAHLYSILVSDGQTVTAGDVIAKSGNTGNSTGPHLHFEVIKNGRHINPIYFSQTNDSVGGPVYGYAGSPMGDGSYAALIEEAEKYIGMPYRWGGSSPSTSFDCSGYVSFVINQSGVGSVGRQTAQGLYNLCTPVSPADAQPGDLIFFTGTYSTAMPVTHVGIYVGGGLMLHCGNPIGYASINTSYWQSHFYSYCRLN